MLLSTRIHCFFFVWEDINTNSRSKSCHLAIKKWFLCILHSNAVQMILLLTHVNGFSVFFSPRCEFHRWTGFATLTWWLLHYFFVFWIILFRWSSAATLVRSISPSVLHRCIYSGGRTSVQFDVLVLAHRRHAQYNHKIIAIAILQNIQGCYFVFLIISGQLRSVPYSLGNISWCFAFQSIRWRRLFLAILNASLPEAVYCR